MWGFGTLTPFAAWAATGRPLDAGHALVLLGFCPLFAGLYPLTQLYQMEEDRRRGDRTLALLLGLRASLGVAIACIVLAFALFGWAAALLGVGAWPLVVPLATWLAVLGAWYGRREALSPAGHQRGMYRALAAWAVADVGAWPWLSFLLDGRAPAARKASRGPRLWASSAPLYSAPSISSCCGPSRRIPGPGTRSAAAARGGICRSGGCSVPSSRGSGAWLRRDRRCSGAARWWRCCSARWPSSSLPVSRGWASRSRSKRESPTPSSSRCSPSSRSPGRASARGGRCAPLVRSPAGRRGMAPDARARVVGVVRRSVGGRAGGHRFRPSRYHARRGRRRCHALRVHRALHLGPVHAPGPAPLVPSHGPTHVGGAPRRCRG